MPPIPIIAPIPPSDFNRVAVLENDLHPDAWQANALFELHYQPFIHFMGLGAYEDKRLVGYLLSQCVDSAELLRLGVATRYQGQGVASLLMTAWLKSIANTQKDKPSQDTAKQTINAILEVQVDNAPAIALYQKFGFCIIHTRKNYYKINGQYFDAYVMQKV